MWVIYYTFDFSSKIEKSCYIFIYKTVTSHLKIHTNDVCCHCLSPHQCLSSTTVFGFCKQVNVSRPVLATEKHSGMGLVYVCWDIPVTKPLSCLTTVSISFCLSLSFFRNWANMLFFLLVSFIFSKRVRAACGFTRRYLEAGCP